MSELEDRPVTDRDRREIIDLIHAYADLIDRQQFDEVAGLFAPTGVLRVYDRPHGEARGREEIAALAARLIDAFEATRHDVSDTVLEFAGAEEATGTTELHAWHRFRADRPDGILWGRYRDTFAQVDSRWLIAHRTLTVAREQSFTFPWIAADPDAGVHSTVPPTLQG